MNNKRLKQKNDSIKKSTKLLIVLLLTLVALFITIWFYQYSKYLDLLVAEQDMINKIESEKLVKEDLLRKKEYQGTDKYIEEIARKELNMIKPNEMIIIEQYDEDN